MSGHMTRMSRGSRVGSSSSSPTSTSRSTSTWRAAPWQACTCRLRSSAAGTRADRSSASGRGWRGGRAGASRAGSGPVLRRGRRGAGDARRRRGAPAQLAGVAAQGGQQRVVDPLGGRVVVARDRPRRARGGRPRAPARAAGARGGRHVARRARQQLDLGDRQPRVAEEGEPVGQVELRSVRSAAAPPSRSCRTSGGGAGDPGEQPTPQLGLPEQVGVEGLPAPSVSRPGAPVGRPGRPLHGVRREDAGQPSRDRPAAGPAKVDPRRRRGRGRGGRRGWPPTARRGGRRGPRAAARPAGRDPRRRRARARAAARPASAG